MKQLRSLHNLVRNRILEKSQQKIKDMYYLKNVNDPIISTAFYAISLEYHVAIRDQEEAIKLKEEVIQRTDYTNAETKFWYFKSLGYYEFTYGDINKSLDYLYQSSEWLSQLIKPNDSQLEYLLALANSRVMLISRSLYHNEQALKLYNEEMNFERVIDCKLLLGINYSKMGFGDKAESHFINLIDHLSINDYQMVLGKVYHNLGFLYLQKGDIDKSIELLEKALKIKKNKDEKFNTLYLLAIAYKKQGNERKSLDFSQKGMGLTKSVNFHFYYKFYILNHYLEENTCHQVEFIHRLENEIIPYYLKQDPLVAGECYALLGQIYSDKAHYKEAFSYYKHAFNLHYKNKRKELLF